MLHMQHFASPVNRTVVPFYRSIMYYFSNYGSSTIENGIVFWVYEWNSLAIQAHTHLCLNGWLLLTCIYPLLSASKRFVMMGILKTTLWFLCNLRKKLKRKIYLVIHLPLQKEEGALFLFRWRGEINHDIWVKRALAEEWEHTEMSACSSPCKISLTFQPHSSLCYRLPCSSPPTAWIQVSRVCSDDYIKFNSANVCRVATLQQQVSGDWGYSSG